MAVVVTYLDLVLLNIVIVLISNDLKVKVNKQ